LFQVTELYQHLDKLHDISEKLKADTEFMKKWHELSKVSDEVAVTAAVAGHRSAGVSSRGDSEPEAVPISGGSRSSLSSGAN
jgi:hypothetical protein